MTEREVLKWFYHTWYGQVTREVPWLFGAFETLHFLGLSILFGALLLVDLRLLGFFRKIPIGPALKFTHVAVAGFAINIITGLGFFCADPANYWANSAFRLKMALVLIAGANVAYFEVVIRRRVAGLAPDADTDATTKVVAGLSLLLWTTIIVLGRILPQFESF